ncbi:MAG: diguanylate cyclase, partial [Candidatus Thiodiazotropha sp.]
MNNNQEDGTAQPLKLLLIEDNPDDAELVVQYIAGNGLHVDTEVVATEADFTCMLERQWDIILSDYNLPAFSPERALEILHEQQLSLPLLIISGELSQSQAARLMLTGARDFISKDDLSRLIPAINRELNVARLQREKVKIEEHISHLANFDEATSLPNHNYFNCTLERLNGKPNNNIYIIAHINLNRLGMISDIHGEKISNALVRETATRIHRLDDESLFARIGPNDFAFLLENRSTCDECNSACQKIYQIFDAPFLVENREHFLTPTIGVSCYPCHGNSADKILRNAKYAMRHAMRTQRTIQHYDTTIEEEDITRELISDRLQSALLHDGFKLKYQPKVSTSDGAVSAFEVLIRWNDEQLGIIPPDRFIPIAEETGNITAIGLWVLKEACFQAMEW